MITCNLCNNKGFKIISNQIRDSKKHKIIKCKKCNHLQLFPKPSKLENKKFYDKNKQVKNTRYDFNLDIIEKKAFEDTHRRIKIIEKLAKQKDKILEVGSGHGFFLNNITKLGFDITGIEISKQRREIAKRVSHTKVLEVDLNTNISDIGKFDMVLLFHVLEHITEPVEFLNKIKKLLTENGKIIIEVPNVEDHQLKTNKDYTDWYWQKAHLNYFSSNTLRNTLKKAKFKKISIIGNQRYSIENFFYWKINKKPQFINPTKNMSKEFQWIENHYKTYLEKNLICDTIISIAIK